MITIKQPFPGYIVLKPYILNQKVGNWSVPSEDPENAPELGEVIQVGPEIAKMPYDAKYLPKVGDVIAYKKYNHFKFAIGSTQYYLVSFENILFELEVKNV